MIHTHTHTHTERERERESERLGDNKREIGELERSRERIKYVNRETEGKD